MDVQQILNATATATPPKATDRKGSSELGKDQFLKLMLAQMQNQDPTKPQDSQELATQLAQFTSVEQLQKANTSLDDILLAQATNSQMAATNFVGRDAMFHTDAIDWKAGTSTSAGAYLGATASEITATISDGTRVIRTLKLGGHNAGAIEVPWDGKRDDGSFAPDGSYKVEIKAKDANGKDVAVDMRSHGIVEGVSFESGAPALRIGSQKVSMSQVIEINQRSNP
ncbi:MAG: flagellar hook capping FlgD N-terminal domain-containing protein [Deltaproteobacteria bacterium]|nr:flagellar hook capping FlgD N-terminal domain-containing protein [Deltaproteobacteria bacterium]